MTEILVGVTLVVVLIHWLGDVRWWESNAQRFGQWRAAVIQFLRRPYVALIKWRKRNGSIQSG